MQDEITAPLKQSDKQRLTALTTQLEVLQSRITTHGNRVWQLPFTYVSFAAISTSLLAGENRLEISLSIFFSLVSAVGIVVLWAMIDAWRSYLRTAEVMNRVERELGIEECTSGSIWHAAPHLFLCLAAVVTFGFAAIS